MYTERMKEKKLEENFVQQIYQLTGYEPRVVNQQGKRAIFFD